MTEDGNLMSLPFLIRKMLQFDFAASFKLRIDTNSTGTGHFYVLGATRSGQFKYRVDTVYGTPTQTDVFQINDAPIYISIIDSDTTYTTTATYVQCSLQLNGDISNVLCSGYIDNGITISYPQTSVLPKTPLHTYPKIMTVAAPAAGNDVATNPAVGDLWRIHSLSVPLTTSATVANRYLEWKFKFGTIIIAAAAQTVAQTAASTFQHVCQLPGASACQSGSNFITSPLPAELWMNNGIMVTTNVVNMQAADQLGQLTILIERYSA
jgi:hypothetical protein